MGSFCEWSTGLVSLIDTIAHMGKAAWQGRLGVPTAQTAHATIKRLMRQELGIVWFFFLEAQLLSR